MKESLPMMYFVTAPDEKTAMKLANGLVREKMAACANVLENLTSIYWWKGQINTDKEFLILIKTTAENSERLITYIQTHHPYEVPECIGINITKGSQQYLQWIADSINGDK